MNSGQGCITVFIAGVACLVAAMFLPSVRDQVTRAINSTVDGVSQIQGTLFEPTLGLFTIGAVILIVMGGLWFIANRSG